MMSDVMEYKGYYSNPRYSAEDNVFWGKLEGINDSVSFEGTTVGELQAAFSEAVEDYLDTCRRHGMTPKTPFQGRLEVSVAPDLHKQLTLFAANRDVSLNQAIEIALKGYLASAS
jgi:predicted HicB family RNase H-like nuclease